jgi:hypothetical protein
LLAALPDLGSDQYFACSSNCPTPTQYDADGGEECSGRIGGWAGCR